MIGSRFPDTRALPVAALNPEITRIEHETQLIPPIYVKPFVNRQKNETAQASAAIFHTRDLLVRQRTQLWALLAHNGLYRAPAIATA